MVGAYSGWRQSSKLFKEGKQKLEATHQSKAWSDLVQKAKTL